MLQENYAKVNITACKSIHSNRVLEKSQGRESEPGTGQAVKCDDTHTQVTTGFRGVLVKNCSKNIPSTPHTLLVDPQGGMKEY